MGALSIIDLLIIVAFLLFSFAVGVLVKDKASEGGVEGFFTAGRDMKWWALGTSIVATTFASDTPLAITGWISKYGIAGNWFWWGGALGTVAMTVFFARKWRTSGVVTDVELSEMRYGGRPAAVLRTVKAAISSTLVNCIILGWVLAGMAKITEPFMAWELWLGSSFYGTIDSLWPDIFIFNTLDNTITIMILILVTVVYSTIGGLRAVIITDLVQFAIAMGMSIFLAYAAVQHAGGMSATWTQLEEIYPSDHSAQSASGEVYLTHEQVRSFMPSFDDIDAVGALGFPLSAFLLTMGMMWWANGNVDGSGYLAQRLYTAEDGGHAEKGALWYAVANFMLRSWPWAITGVAALVIFPRTESDHVARQFTMCLNDASQCTEQMTSCIEDRYSCQIEEYGLLQKSTGTIEEFGLNPLTKEQRAGKTFKEVPVFKDDRERSYPALIKKVLPIGLIGLAISSLMAAFMSTVSTHINWGASYITNDFYYRYFNPKASDKQLTLVSRLSTVGIAIVAIFIGKSIDNIGAAWEFWGAMMAGLGMPHVLRWLWWRTNAWTELSGMIAGVTLAILNFFLKPDGAVSILPEALAPHPINWICWVSGLAGGIAILVTFLTKEVPEDLLVKFCEKVKPMGFWKGLNKGYSAERSLGESLLYFATGSISIYCGMFGLGYLLRLEYLLGGGLLVLFVGLLYFTVKGMEKVDLRRDV